MDSRQQGKSEDESGGAAASEKTLMYGHAANEPTAVVSCCHFIHTGTKGLTNKPDF